MACPLKTNSGPRILPPSSKRRPPYPSISFTTSPSKLLALCSSNASRVKSLPLFPQNHHATLPPSKTLTHINQDPLGSGPFFHNHPNTHHNTTTTPTIMPANFNTATLFPLCAIRPRRPALPLMLVVMEEKTSFCESYLEKCQSGYNFPSACGWDRRFEGFLAEGWERNGEDGLRE